MEPVILRISAGGKLLLEEAIGWVQFTIDSGFRGWKGHFTPPRGEILPPGGPYVLETSDGRRGCIIIEPSPPGAKPEVEVTFTGTGPFE